MIMICKEKKTNKEIDKIWYLKKKKSSEINNLIWFFLKKWLDKLYKVECSAKIDNNFWKKKKKINVNALIIIIIIWNEIKIKIIKSCFFLTKEKLI